MIRPHIIEWHKQERKQSIKRLNNVGMTAIEELGDEEEDKPTIGIVAIKTNTRAIGKENKQSS